MNIFAPQSIESKTELEEIADLKLQIIIPKTSSPTIAMVQDQLIGIYNLTSEKFKINWRVVMNLLSGVELDELVDVSKDKDYTGKEIYSNIIPSNINLIRGDPANPKILIQHGRLDKGILGDDVLGFKKNGLVQLVWDEYGVESTRKFIDNTSRLANNYNMFYGMSVGIKDLHITKDLHNQIKQLYETKKIELNHEITEVENNPDMSNEKLFEYSVNSKMAVIRDDASKLIMANTGPDNGFVIMMNCGKGAAINFTQMCGIIGQQDFHGGRMPKNYNDRTLPYFYKNDDRAEARGFIESSFLNGLNLPNLIFNSIAAREGMIDQAVRTSESGYIQRKLIKSTEDSMVNYDGTVRNAVGRILQFTYGDSGADTIKQYEYHFKLMDMSNSEVEIRYKFTIEEMKKVKNFSEKDNESYYKNMLKIRDTLRKTQVKATLDYITLGTTYMLPVNLHRIVDNIRNTDELKGDVCYDVMYIMNMITNILKNENTMLCCMTQKERENPNSVKFRDDQTAKTAFRFALFDILAPKKCMFNYKLSIKQLETISKDIIKNFNKNIVEPGEMVGLIAAQSLGEPITQLMLKAIHSAGIGGKGGTDIGVDRIREVFSLSKNPKAAFMTIYLNKEYQNKKDFANKIASYIKFTTIKDIRQKIEIFYDPEPYEKDGFFEKDNIIGIFQTHQPNKESCSNSIDGLPWLMRIEFDKEKLLNKEVSLLDIKSKFCYAWEKRYQDIKAIRREKRQVMDKINQLAILSNTDNDDIPIIHIRFDMINFNSNTLVDFMEMFVDAFKLKGMEDIEDISGGKPYEERFLSFDNAEQTVEKKSEYVIYTKGINMDAIKNIIGVDLNRTSCNDIITIYEHFGIEAARTRIIREIHEVLTSNGSGTNYQHIAIFGDLMTNVGTLTSIDRFGLNKLDTDPLSRASFEKTVDQLITAAVFNEIDYMKSVSSRIMAGLCIKGGTGLCNLVIDKDLLENSEYTTDIGQLYQKTYNDITSIQQTQEIDTEVFIPEI
jgi:DNA-directed RNA polymerase II subunit RPB1